MATQRPKRDNRKGGPQRIAGTPLRPPVIAPLLLLLLAAVVAGGWFSMNSISLRDPLSAGRPAPVDVSAQDGGRSPNPAQAATGKQVIPAATAQVTAHSQAIPGTTQATAPQATTHTQAARPAVTAQDIPWPEPTQVSQAVQAGQPNAATRTALATTAEITALAAVTQSAPMDAAGIVRRAMQAEKDPSGFGLRSYYGTIVSPSGPDQYPAQTWFQAPAHKRVQVSNGPTFLFDATRAWRMDRGRVSLIDPGRWGGPATGFLRIPFALQDAGARLLKTENIAGRAAYVLELSPGPSTPPPSPKEPGNGFHLARVWFDQQFYIPLRIDLISDVGQAEMTWSFGSFTANPTLDGVLFAFTLSTGVTVDAERAPDAMEIELLWGQQAAKVAYTLFRPAPGSMPTRFTALGGPVSTRGAWTSESYYSRQPADNFSGLPSGVTIIEMAARPVSAAMPVLPTAYPIPPAQGPTSAPLLSNAPAATKPQPSPTLEVPALGVPALEMPAGSTMPVQIGSYSGSYVEGNNSRWVVFEQDGTQIWVEGQGNVSKAELLTVAGALRPVQVPAAVTPVAVPTLPLPVPTAQALATQGAQAGMSHFGEGEIEFVDALHGWYLADRCSDGQEGNCTRQIVATRDGGASWIMAGSQPRGISHIRFANSVDGWAYGPALYSTHDGGASWAVSNIVPGDSGIEVTGVEWLGGKVAALAQSCMPDPARMSTACASTLYISEDRGATWRPVRKMPAVQLTGGRLGRSALSPQAPAAREGWLQTKEALLVTHDGGGTWQAHAGMPCSQEDGMPLIGGDMKQGLWLVCGNQPGAGSQKKSVYKSSDEGTHWVMIAETARGQGSGDIPISGYVYSLAVSSPQRAWLSLQRGTLYSTTDGGRHWQRALPMPGDGSVGKVLFTDEKHGWWLTLGDLYHTTDGGTHWDKLAHP
ncbi:MAG: hypothetical protein M3014_13025 [Chloroflexota bacterium]|nr:hypothetical protein [Chloroflexota bacterium]